MESHVLSNKKLTPSQALLLRQLVIDCPRMGGVNCKGKKWIRLLALENRGLAESMYYRRGRPTVAGIELVESWKKT